MTHNARRYKNSINIVGDEKNKGDEERVPPIPKLSSGDEHSRDPTDDNSCIRNEAQDANHDSQQQRKIEMHKNNESCGNHRAVDETDEKLTSEKSDDDVVDFEEERSYFVL